jgi:hypothetical protein
VELFEAVGEVVRGLVPRDLGEVKQRAHKYGVKVWFDTERPTSEHYEAQVIGRRYVPEAEVLAIELGFHAENSKAAENDAVLAALLRCEAKWRKTLGDEAVAGEFLGRTTWRRISETWPDPDLEDPELVLELGTRLTDYITAIEPLRPPPSRRQPQGARRRSR